MEVQGATVENSESKFDPTIKAVPESETEHNLEEGKQHSAYLICRLCAQILTVEHQNWIHIEKLCESPTSRLETVQSIIEKCVPGGMLIQVDENKSPVICTFCYRSLQDVMTFYAKIRKGQESLKRMLVDLSFAKNIESIAPPRKRGRPRKGTEPAKDPLSLQVPEPTTTRGKRSCRSAFRNDDDGLLVTIETAPEGSNQTNELEQKEVEGGNGDECVLEQLTKPAVDNQIIESVSDDESDISVQSSKSIGTLSWKTSRRKGSKRKRGRPRKIPKSREFKCDICQKTYFHYSSLVYHRLSAHENKREFICTVCDKRFNHKSLLANHLFTHGSYGTFECDQPNCKRTFKTRYNLYNHKIRDHTSSELHRKEYTCETCGLQFGRNSHLIAHSKLHTGEKPHCCSFCNKKFSHKPNLNQHIRTHTGEKPFKCSQKDCEKAFTTKSQLSNHIQTHSESKSFLCTTCGKAFNTRASMRLCDRRHNGKMSEECSICHKMFFDKCSLRKHKRCHTGERPYQCSVCNAKFADSSNCAKHKKIHESISPSPSSQEAGAEGNETAVEISVEVETEPLMANNEQIPEKDLLTSDDPTMVQVLTPSNFLILNEDGSSPVEVFVYQTTDEISENEMQHPCPESNVGSTSESGKPGGEES